MSAPKPGVPADNLLKELQQGRKMQMIEALQVKLLEDQRRSLRHFELVQDGLSRMRSGAVLSNRPHTALGSFPHGSDAEKRAEAMHRMSFSETLRQEVESARVACDDISRTQEKAAHLDAKRGEEQNDEDTSKPSTAPTVTISTEPKPSPPSPRMEAGSQSLSLSLKSFKSMKTAGTVKFRHQGSEEEGQNADALSSFTDVSPVNRADEVDELLGFVYHHVEKTERWLDPSDPLRRVPLVCHAGIGERLKHKGRVMDLAFSNDGTRLASADDEGHLACWQAVPPKTIWEAKASSVSRFAVSPSAKHLAASNLRGRVYVWNIDSSKSVTKEMSGEVMVLTFVADDKLAIALSESVRLYAIPEFQEVVELVQPGVSSLCASPDTTQLIAVGGAADPSQPAGAHDAEGCVIWDVSVFGRIGSIVFVDKVHALAYQPDGARFAAAGDGKLVSVFTVDPFAHSFDLPCASSVHALAWSPTMRCLASGGDDGTIRVWDLVKKQSLFQLSEGQECISCLTWGFKGVLAFSHPKAKEICVALLDELTSLCSDTPTEATVAPAPVEEPTFVLSVRMVSSASGGGAAPPLEQAAAAGPDQEGFLVQIQRDRVDSDSASLNLGTRSQGLQQVQPATSILHDNGQLSACVFMPHDQTIMVAGKNIVENQVHQKQRIREIGLPKPATVLAVSPCGGFLAASSDNFVTVYRLSAAREEPILSRKVESTVSKLALSALNFLAIGLDDKVLFCHLSDNKDPRQLVMTGEVKSIAFSPAGDVLAVAAGGDDSRARTSMWVVARDQCHYLGAVMSKQARCLAFSTSGKILAVGCDDGKIPLLLPEQGYKCWTEMRLVSDLTCRSLAWAGSFLAAAGQTQVSLFNVASGQEVLQLPSYEETILDLSLSSSGSMLAVCFQSHVNLHPLEECEAEVSHGTTSIQVPSDREKVKSKGTTANLGEVLESSGSVMHSIKLTFSEEVAVDDSELKAPAVRKLGSVGSCGKLQKGETSESVLSGPEEETAPPTAAAEAREDGDLQIPGLAILKPRISVTDLSQDGQSGRNTPEEEDAEAAQLRRRALLGRDLGLDPALLCKINTTDRPGGIPIKLKHSDEVCSLSFSQCSRRLAAGGYDQHLVIWDAENMSRVGELHLEADVISVAFSPCGKYIYCGDNEREVHVFSAETLEVLGKEVLKEAFVSLVGISSPTTLLAVASHIVVKVFSVPDVKEVISLHHGGQVHSLSYAPSLGMLSAAGGIDITESGLLSYSSSSSFRESAGGMKAVVWKSSSDLTAWKEFGTVNYKDPCHASSFAPSGKVLALGGEDRTISLFSVEKQFRKVEQLPCAAGIRCLSWAANSRLLASAGEDMRVSVWDVLYKRVVLHLPKADDWLCSIAFSGNSKWLAACGYGQDTVDLWPIEVEVTDPNSRE